MGELTIADLFDPAELQAEIDAGYVTRKAHPSLPLSIVTYTRSAQYDAHWTSVTMQCRGLVIEDDTSRVVALPWPKFFNVSEHELNRPHAPALPDEPFEIFDKVDGSLAIVFHYDGRWLAASKASFTSDQAAWAQCWLDERDTSVLDPTLTYLAEILYRENRIVVRYDHQGLVLLGAYDLTGSEHGLDEVGPHWNALGGTVVRSWSTLPLPELMRLAAENTKIDGTTATGTDAEGWVIRFESGLRAKVKLGEYVRLHKTLTGTSARDVWRYLGAEQYADMPPKVLGAALGCSEQEAAALAAIEGGALSALLDAVPDEFDQWVRDVVAGLTATAEQLAERIGSAYAGLKHLRGNRGDFARAAQAIEDRAVRAAVFLVLDGRPVHLHVWKAIRPTASDPFATDEEG